MQSRKRHSEVEDIVGRGNEKKLAQSERYSSRNDKKTDHDVIRYSKMDRSNVIRRGYGDVASSSVIRRDYDDVASSSVIRRDYDDVASSSVIRRGYDDVSESSSVIRRDYDDVSESNSVSSVIRRDYRDVRESSVIRRGYGAVSESNSVIRRDYSDVRESSVIRRGYGDGDSHDSGDSHVSYEVKEEKSPSGAVSSLLSDQYASLGQVSDDPRRYFDISEESVSCARLFLKVFFERFASKMVKQYRRLAEVKLPGTISFVTAIISQEESTTGKEEKYCFVSISLRKGLSLWRWVKEIVDLLNKNFESRYQFKYDDSTLNHFANSQALLNPIVKELMKHKKELVSTRKVCAEALYVSSLMQHYAKHGTGFHVTGSITCQFYPFANHGQINYEEDHVVEFPPHLSKQNIKESKENSKRLGLHSLGKFNTYEVYCCLNCQLLKKAVLEVLLGSQNHIPMRMERSGVINSPEAKSAPAASGKTKNVRKHNPFRLLSPSPKNDYFDAEAGRRSSSSTSSKRRRMS